MFVLTINRMLASTVFKKTKGTGSASNKALKTTPFGRSDAFTRGGFAIMPHATAPLSLMLCTPMRLLLISILCVFLFFPAYWLFHYFVGPNWGSGIAVVLCWLVLPYLLLKKWASTRSRIFIVGNYLLAIIVLALSMWVLYKWLFVGEDLQDSVRLLFLYIFAAVFYLAQGRMPYQKEKETSDGEST
ncbi:hypothetical protein [Alteromonas gracilis]|uniref:hypothetical protein n=1 Tax=Alteromonas gracilis TaxID=1479524 RepID=UPI0036F31FC7